HRDEKGEAVRVTQENYNEFKTKNGSKVFDGGGVLPDENLSVVKSSVITNALVNNNVIFDFATTYYYSHKIEDINTFKLTDTDFSNFKNYLKTQDFSFETATEKALLNALNEAKKEGLNEMINTDYNTLVSNLKISKSKTIDENKTHLLELLTEDIVKRYVYREGLYDYYKIHDSGIKKATEILNKPVTYLNYLR